MRICVISTPIFPVNPPNGTTGYAGLEVIAWQQARGLAERGHAVLLVAPDGSSCPGVEVVPCGPPGHINEEQAYGGFPEIREGDKVIRPPHPGYWQRLLDCDVVVDHSWNKYALLLKQEGRLSAPVLCWMHAPVNTMIASPPPGVAKPCFVCISRDQAAHFEALFGCEARHCYNGVDLDTYRPLGIPRTDRCLFLARFSTVKGPDLAIDACLRAGVGLDLIGDTTITGEPEFLARCQAMARQQTKGWDHTKGEQIHLVGGVPRGNTVWWYSRANAFLHPNQRFREPFGLAPVEAMACGVPVLAFDYGAMRETVAHGETGWLVRTVEDMAAVLETIKAHPGEVDDMRPACMERAKRFSLAAMINRVEELCQEAARTGGW